MTIKTKDDLPPAGTLLRIKRGWSIIHSHWSDYIGFQRVKEHSDPDIVLFVGSTNPESVYVSILSQGEIKHVLPRHWRYLEVVKEP